MSTSRWINTYPLTGGSRRSQRLQKCSRNKESSTLVKLTWLIGGSCWFITRLQTNHQIIRLEESSIAYALAYALFTCLLIYLHRICMDICEVWYMHWAQPQFTKQKRIGQISLNFPPRNGPATQTCRDAQAHRDTQQTQDRRSTEAIFVDINV